MQPTSTTQENILIAWMTTFDSIDEVTVSELGDYVPQEQSTVNTAFQRLVRDKYATRRQITGRGRTYFYSLTEAGRTLAERLVPVPDDEPDELDQRDDLMDEVDQGTDIEPATTTFTGFGVLRGEPGPNHVNIGRINVDFSYNPVTDNVEIPFDQWFDFLGRARQASLAEQEVDKAGVREMERALVE